jgi:hypothetical protein
MSRTAAFLLAMVLCLSGAVGGFFYGHDQGAAAESARRDGKAVQDLTDIIASSKLLIADANKASGAMRKATAQRAAHDAHTSLEFKDALARSADSRSGCVFDADIVRGLQAARDRAAQAAASGIRGSMPSAGSGPGAQRSE